MCSKAFISRTMTKRDLSLDSVVIQRNGELCPQNSWHCFKFHKLAPFIYTKAKKSLWRTFQRAGESKSIEMLSHWSVITGAEYVIFAATPFDVQSRILRERMAGGKKKEEVDMSDVLRGCQKKARDNARTPVQV